MTDHTFQHLGHTWTISCPNDRWYAQSEHFALAGPFDSEIIAHSWVKALVSSGTGVPLQSYPASPNTPNQPVAASYELVEAIPGQQGDEYRLPELVPLPPTPSVSDPLYYVPGPNGTHRSMAYSAILADFGQEKTDELFRPQRIDTPSNPLPGPFVPPKPLSRIGAIFRTLGLRT